jgi:hypothetical protein
VWWDFTIRVGGVDGGLLHLHLSRESRALRSQAFDDGGDHSRVVHRHRRARSRLLAHPIGDHAPGAGRAAHDALVAIRGKERLDGETKWRPRAFSYPEFHEFADQRDVFASVAGWTRHYVALDAGTATAGWRRCSS